MIILLAVINFDLFDCAYVTLRKNADVDICFSYMLAAGPLTELMGTRTRAPYIILSILLKHRRA